MSALKREKKMSLSKVSMRTDVVLVRQLLKSVSALEEYSKLILRRLNSVF